MNLNRIKSNLINRDWNSKSAKTNISYIKGKLNQFGLSAPKYLSQGKITDKQIKIQSKRILKAIEEQQDIARREASIQTMDKAMKKLQKAVDYHNLLVYKKLNYVTKKHNLSENQLNFLIGRDVSIDAYKIKDKVVIKRQNTQFGIISLENFYANDIESINTRIKQINNLNKRLTNQAIDREIAKDIKSLSAIENLLDAYVNDGIMESHVKNHIMEQLKSLNGMQQKAFYNILMASAPKSKYIVSDDEFDELQLNLYNKWATMLQQASRF